MQRNASPPAKRSTMLGSRVTPAEAESFAAVAALNGRSIAAELRLIAAEHVRATGRAINEEAPGVDGSERFERPQEAARDSAT